VSQTAAIRREGVWTQHTSPVDLPGLAAWLIPFTVVVYLAMQNGGYDPVLRSQVGIAVWWIILLGALVGILPALRLNRASWAGLALLAAFVVWTAISLGWTESQERTAADLGKVAAYLGVFALALGAQGKAGMRHALNGVAAAIVVVALLALAYRLQPSWFSPTATDRFFESNRNRLNYPLGYWNALAALMAIGLPVVLQAVATARLLATRALAAAAVPVMILCAFLTVSRGGVFMIAAGLLVYLVLAPERVFRLATLMLAGVGAGILIAAADAREAFKEALTTTAAQQQSDGMLRLVVLVCLGVAAFQVASSLLERHVAPPPWMSPPRDRARLALIVGLAAALLAFAVSGGPGWTSDRWQEFRSTSAVPTSGVSTAFSRLSSVSSNGRYQYWQLSAEARDAAPLQGTGSGTFEFLWSRDGTRGSGFVRDAHSLWMETQGELGWIGFFLVAGFFLLALGMGAFRALREPEPYRRHVYAAATGGIVAFIVAASVEWVWEMAVLPVIVLVLAATVLGGQRPRWVRSAAAETQGRGCSRIVLALSALAATLAIAIPLAGATALRDSQAAIRDGRLASALTDARTAAAIQPSAASPYLQQALIFERAGQLDRAVGYARIATLHETTNWRPWMILSRLEAERGRPAASVAAFRRARSLNTRSLIFLATP
jgi:hypothetical protein